MNFIGSTFIFLILFLSACKQHEGPLKPANSAIDYTSYTCCNSDGTVNVLIEIPAGTTAKYELNKSTNTLEIDSINGKPRYIDYLPYPSNYGMVLNTLLSKSEGGDGDPLDIMVLGSSLKRGSVVEVKLIGGMRLKDNGENDDKLIAIPLGSTWTDVNNLDDLQLHYPGVTEIISIFFKNYKGVGEMEITGFIDLEDANSILEASINE